MEPVKTLEDLYESIGGFGKFQFLALVSVYFPELPSALLLLLPVFIAVPPNTWNCTLFNDGNDSLSNVTSYLIRSDDPGLCDCPGVLSGIGDNSIISEWGLVCDYAWVGDFMTSVQMAGMMIGGPVGSMIADWIGRKRSLYLYCFVMLMMGLASPFVKSPFLYAITRFFIGVGLSSYLLIGTLYPIEILTPKWRSICGAVAPWAEGSMLLALLAYFIDSWKTLSWVAALPMALSLISYPFLPESPRWFLNKGRITDAKKSLDTIAKWNGYPPVDMKVVENLSYSTSTKIQPDSKENGYDDACEKGKKIHNNDNDHVKSKVGCFQFITNSSLRLKMMIFIVTYFTAAIISYGIIFNLKNIGGNIYLNLIYVSVLEGIGFRSAVFINKWLGRRKAYLAYMLLGSCPLVGIILMELNIGIPYSEGIVTILALTGRFFVGGSWASLKGFAGESFSTDTRSSAMGITTVAAALGGVAAPQMVFLGTIYRPIPYFVFGTLAVCSTFLSLLLPETGGKPLQAD